MNIKNTLLRLVYIKETEGIIGILQRINGKRFKLWLKICHYFNKKTIGSVYGIKLNANYTDKTFIFYVCGIYGFFYSTVLKKIGHEFYFFDIGTNQGLYAIIAAKNTFCKKVFSFEPVSSTYKICRENFQLNKVSSKINLYKKAISKTNGNADIYFSEYHSGTASLEKTNSNASNLSEVIETINAEGLNKLINPGTYPIFVKIDVEGHEEIVLNELFKTQFAGNIQQIFYECDENWIRSKNIAKRLKENDFVLKKIGGNQIHYDILASRRRYTTKVCIE